MASEKVPKSYTKFACIGAGFSGINFGCTLQRWYGTRDFKIFERSSEPSGTWHANQYPGCACDVPAAFYSLSYELHPGWTRFLPPHNEVYEYLKRVTTKYDLWPLIELSTEVRECSWNDETKRWTITLLDLKTKETYLHECQILFSGCGVLVNPRQLDVPGIENFSGKVMHSARWDHSVDLSDKNVVLFGNGCTAAQIVPSILPKTKRLTQVVRSRHWMLPPVDSPIPPWATWLVTYVPGLLRAVRIAIFVALERAWLLFPQNALGRYVRAEFRASALKYMRRAPAKYHDILIPDFEVGCKRRIYDKLNGYIPSLSKPNIDLTNDKPLEIVPEGVRFADRTVQADVIVCANGFETNNFVAPIKIVGRGGVRLEDHWTKIGGPSAYNTTSMHDFPNFFMLLGPNSATGHTSTVMAIENACNFALRVSKPLLDGKRTTVEVTEEAERGWARLVQDTMQKTVFSSGCLSWYITTDEQTGREWNGSVYPWSQLDHQRRCTFPVWKDWEYSGEGDGKKLRGRYSSVQRAAIAATILGPALFYLRSQQAAGQSLPLPDLSRFVELARERLGR